MDSEILGAYKEGIAHYNQKARRVLDIFKDKNGELVGSNCFAPIVLAKYLPKGTRIATMADLGIATEINPKFLEGFFSDTGLTLRTAVGSMMENNSLARTLAEQLKKRNISLKTPKVIYFDALDLKEDKNSAYGLIYVLNERAKFGENIINAPELIRDYKFTKIDDKGIPIEDENGSRICYTGQGGLSAFYSNVDSNVSSNDWNLAYSDDSGRVVIVKTSESGHRKNSEANAYELRLHACLQSSCPRIL